MKKKLISHICTFCLLSACVGVHGLGGSTALAEAEDVSQYLNDGKSGTGTSVMWSADTATDNGDLTITVTGTMENGDNWYAHRTEIGFTDLAMGSGVEQTIGHAGWTISNPNNLKIDLAYRNNSSRYEIAVWDMSAGTFKDKNQDAFVAKADPTSYRGDFFINLETKEYRIYINNVLFSEASLSGSQLKNLFLNVRPPEGNFSFTVSNVTREIYNSGTTLNDVVAYTLKNNNANNYYWSVNGIGNIGGISGQRMVGDVSAVNGGNGVYNNADYIISASEANSGIGFKLRSLTSDGTNTVKGCLPKDNNNDNIIHQSLDITPSLTNGNKGQIGFRGNNALYLNRFSFGGENGYVNGRSYHFDILINNKDKGYKVFINGKECASGTLEGGYLSEIIYSMEAAGADTLTLSNIVTKSYDYTVSMNAISELLTVPTDPILIKDLTVLFDSNCDYEISACAIFNNVSETYNNAKLIYALYKNGILVSVNGTGVTEELAVDNEEIKVKYKNVSRKYPYCLLKLPGEEVNQGDTLTVKAQLFDGETYRMESDEASFTIE